MNKTTQTCDDYYGVCEIPNMDWACVGITAQALRLAGMVTLGDGIIDRSLTIVRAYDHIKIHNVPKD